MIKPSGYKRNHFVVTVISAKNRCPENTPSYFLAQQSTAAGNQIISGLFTAKYGLVQHLIINVRARGAEVGL